MTREEQIYKEAVEYVKYSDNILKQLMGECFTDGAKWADANPSYELIRKILPLAIEAEHKINWVALADEDLTNKEEFNLRVKYILDKLYTK